jgi:hypothetical protein
MIITHRRATQTHILGKKAHKEMNTAARLLPTIHIGAHTNLIENKKHHPTNKDRLCERSESITDALGG